MGARWAAILVLLVMIFAACTEAAAGRPEDAAKEKLDKRAGDEKSPPGKERKEASPVPSPEPTPSPDPAPSPSPPSASPPGDVAPEPVQQPSPSESLPTAGSHDPDVPPAESEPVSPPRSRVAPAPVVPSSGDEFDIAMIVQSAAPSPGGSAVVEGTSVAVPTPKVSGWAFFGLGGFAVGAVSLGALLLRPKRSSRAATPVAVSVPIPVAPASAFDALTHARVLCGKKEWGQAVAWFDLALALEPELAVAHFCRGLALAELGRAAEARCSFRSAVELDPEEGAYRLHLARASAVTGMTREAMDVLSPLLVAMPELAGDLREDSTFDNLRDHPRFLAMIGAL